VAKWTAEQKQRALANLRLPALQRRRQPVFYGSTRSNSSLKGGQFQQPGKHKKGNPTPKNRIPQHFSRGNRI